MKASGTKRIIFEQPDGSLGIDIPIAAIADDPQALVDWENEMLARNPTWIHRATIEDSALPARHRRTRGGWRWNAGVVEVDLPTARTDTMAQMRAERNTKLEGSDGLQLRANESGTEQQKADWNTYRQSLRDLPVTVQADIDALGTAAGIEGYAIPWPTEPS